MPPLRSITEAFAHDDPDCPACRGTGTVCEEHPDRPWDDGGGDWVNDGVPVIVCKCGAPGEPCPIFMAMHS